MTIEEVASKMGITKGTLSAALNGNPTIGYLERVANAIDCDIRDLFKQTERESINGSLFVFSTYYQNPAQNHEIYEKSTKQALICQKMALKRLKTCEFGRNPDHLPENRKNQRK